MDVFFATVFKRDGISLGNIKTTLDKLGQDKFEENYAIPLAKSFTDLQDLYEKKYDLRDGGETALDEVRDSISSIKLETLKLFKRMGLTPKERNKRKSGWRKETQVKK